MNIKTNLLEEYIDYVDNTKRQNKYFKNFFYKFYTYVFIFMFCFIQY